MNCCNIEVRKCDICKKSFCKHYGVSMYHYICYDCTDNLVKKAVKGVKQ